MEAPAFWPLAALRFTAWSVLLGLGGLALWQLYLGADAARRSGASRLGLALAGTLLATRTAALYAQTWAFFAPFDPVDLAAMRTVATGTAWGTGWCWQTAAALAIGLAAISTFRTPLGWVGLAAAVLVAALAEPLTGHAVEGGAVGIAWLLQALHVAAAVLWIGGLAALVAAVRSGRHEPAAVRAAVDRFSPLALGSAAVLVVTGAVTTWLYTTRLDELWTTPWGRALLLKLSLVAAVSLLGHHNWRKVRPTLGAPESSRRLARVASLELLLAVLVLALTALLVALPMPAG